MPARVHALLVVRADSAGAAAHLERTLEALRDQERPAEALTIVLTGSARPAVDDLVAASGAESVITAPRGTGHAGALRLASLRLGEADPAEGSAVWLLAQDTAPEPDALLRLAGSLELQPSVFAVAPKLVEWDDRDEIVSLGVTMTRLGRTVGLADGQLDQGQHDADEDALASDARGVLVRRGAWDALDGLDPALLGGDEGLDLGVRARLAGGRVALVPTAHVAVAGDGVAGLPAPTDRRRRRRRAYVIRTAQLHRRLAYAHPLAVPFVWLSLLPLALWRTVTHLVRKAPGAVPPEWAATVTAWARLGAIARSRARISGASRATGIRVPWAQLAPLRVRGSELRRRFDTPDDDARGEDANARSDLRFFTGGGAWVVIAALVAGGVAFVSLLAWPTLGGGGILPLHERLGALWGDTMYGQRDLGLDVVGPADPFAAVIALVGSMAPWHPSQALVVLWILGLPLAAFGGWFAATRITERSGLRMAGAVLWALAPTFLTALVQGRPGAVIAHLLLPWLLYTGAVAHRSWASAGAASVLFAGVLACAPSLAPALLILWLVALIAAGRGAVRVGWIPIPAIALFAPLVAERGLRDGQWWSLLGDPGVVWAGAQAGPDAAGRALLAAGFPSPDLAGWLPVLGEGRHLWVLLLAAPLAVLALLSLLTMRIVAGATLIGIALVGGGTAAGATLLFVQFAGEDALALWPGAGLSLAWLGVAGAALVAADAPVPRVLKPVLPWVAVLAVAGVVVLSAPALTASARGESALTNGPESTLPAFVAAVGSDDPDVGTIVVRPLDDGALSSRVVWGASETLGGQSTMLSTRTEETADDRAVAALTAALVTPGVPEIVADLEDHGIRFVLLAPAPAPESDEAKTLRLQSVATLDALSGLESVGDTPRGRLWRVVGDVAPRPTPTSGETALAGTLGLIQLAAVAIALLLALPTAASRRAARRYPRVVGARAAREPVHGPPVESAPEPGSDEEAAP